jgi:hypothetical protein
MLATIATATALLLTAVSAVPHSPDAKVEVVFYSECI